MKYSSIACVADNTIKAQKVLKFLLAKYNITELPPKPKDDLIIVLGGDGFMLHTLHKYMSYNIPFFGMNVGNVGFLLNEFNHEDLLLRIKKSKPTIIHPLKMEAVTTKGEIEKRLAINEVSLMRSTNQAAKIRISVNDSVQILELVSDGVMVATPAGSSAYNFSVGGSIIPLGSNILALTPISPFRPRRWSGALLPHNATIKLEILEFDKRPVNAVADFLDVTDVSCVTIEEDRDSRIKLLFDEDHSLEERIIKEQFTF